MGRRPSSIDALPEDIRSQLNEWLRDGRLTQRQITAMTNGALAEAGEDQRVTKSSVNRYAQRMEEVGAKLRQSREISKMWIDRLGAQPQGELGNLVNEMLRSLSFEVSMQLQESELSPEQMPATIEMLKELSLATQRLERASSENVKRAAEIRRQALAEAAERAGEEAKAGGLSDETVEQIRKKIMMGAA